MKLYCAAANRLLNACCTNNLRQLRETILFCQLHTYSNLSHELTHLEPDAVAEPVWPDNLKYLGGTPDDVVLVNGQLQPWHLVVGHCSKTQFPKNLCLRLICSAS